MTNGYYCKTCKKRHWFKYFGIWDTEKEKERATQGSEIALPLRKIIQ